MCSQPLSLANAGAVLALVVSLIGIAPGRAVAQEVRPIHKATEAFNAGRYAQAVEYLQEAYREDPQPIYLFNIARAFEEAGDDEQAIVYFQRVLDARPGISLERPAAKRLSEARVRLAAKPIPTPNSDQTDGARWRWGPWVMGAGGVVGVGTGGVLYYLASDLRSQVKGASTSDAGLVDGMSQQDAFQRRERADALATSGVVIGTTGALLTLGAIAWALWQPPGEEKRVRMSILPSNRSFGAFFQVSF